MTMARGKRNWSKSEPSVRKPHAAHMAAKVTRYSPNTSTVKVTVDPTIVRPVDKSAIRTRELTGEYKYQPPIVGKSICR